MRVGASGLSGQDRFGATLTDKPTRPRIQSGAKTLFVENQNKPEHERVARKFVSRDRKEAVFLVRMNEARRDQRRVDVVSQLRSIAYHNGFVTDGVAGLYYLEGRLAELVASSLVTGLFWLNVIFIGIAIAVARSVRGAFAMILSLALVPICMLGAIGWLRLPMDIISAPATNVCIGIAIDSMIHLVFGVRRAWRDEKWAGPPGSPAGANSGAVLFTPTDFPPTQRFGLVVLGGLMIDILANLFVLPLLGGAEWKQAGSAAEQTVTAST